MVGWTVRGHPWNPASRLRLVYAFGEFEGQHAEPKVVEPGENDFQKISLNRAERTWTVRQRVRRRFGERDCEDHQRWLTVADVASTFRPIIALTCIERPSLGAARTQSNLSNFLNRQMVSLA